MKVSIKVGWTPCSYLSLAQSRWYGWTLTEYGYCSLVKATKAVLEKLKVENKTFARITPGRREERKLLNPVALREARGLELQLKRGERMLR